MRWKTVLGGLGLLVSASCNGSATRGGQVLSGGGSGPGTITEFAAPPGSGPLGAIIAGPDGNLWFAQGQQTDPRSNFGVGKVGRISTAGVVSEFVLGGSGPLGLTVGPDGKVWFTNSLEVGRISTSGAVEIAFADQDGNPIYITTGPDSNIWFTEINGNRVFRLAPSAPSAGTADAAVLAPATAFTLPDGFRNAGAIETGPDGNLWFTLESPRKLARISPSGTITVISLPGVEAPRNPDAGGSYPDLVGDLAAGPDGKIWFTSPFSNRVGRISTAGVVDEFPLPSPGSLPGAITAGPDGALWFTEYDARKIARISVTGAITEFPLPTSTGHPASITTGPDGNIWFTESESKIGRLHL